MSLFSIAPSAPFLPCLCDAVMDGRLLSGWDRSGPFWLSDVTIVLPTQRARQALAAAFAAHPGFTGLLPDIRTFGGEEADEEPFLPPFDAPAAPHPASRLERRLVLSRLVAAWARSDRGREAFSTPPTAAEIFSMADSLGRLVDDLTIEERSAADIAAIGADLQQGLSEYWQQTLQFLGIALDAWPEWLAQHDRSDPASLRGTRLDRQALAIGHLFGERPVIAAGSTGSIPATARLLRAIAALPRGAVVLPGLDLALSKDTIESLRDPLTNPHGHPQYGLVQLLAGFGRSPADVTELCGRAHPRTALVNHALAPTADTARWAELRPDTSTIAVALDGVSIIRARQEDEEARAIALAARQALADGQTVGIVTPDRNLARRIAAELRRYSIEVDDAAGAPLFQSPAGRLARKLLTLVVNGFAAVDLLAVLRNRATLLGRSRPEVAAIADDIDLGLLRGQHAAPGIDGLRRLLARHGEADAGFRPARRLDPERRGRVAALLDALQAAMRPLQDLLGLGQIDAAALAMALKASLDALAGDAPLVGHEAFAAWANQMETVADRGHPFPPSGLDAVLAVLMAGFDVPSAPAPRQDIFIWGQLEARLMSPDLLILAALNEDKWPGPADPGPWLSRGMRLAAGLEPPERQQGLAAHDFAQAMGNGRVIVAYADRIGASPALPSRLVQRLDAFVGAEAATALRLRGQRWIEAARALDATPPPPRALRPAPNPPVRQRPRQISVTEIETLMRSPYDLYAKHVLGLRPLDALGEDPDARERGTIVHAIFARFVTEGHDPSATDALDRLMTIATEAFSGLDAIGERRDIWLRRFATAAGQFLEFERSRAAHIHARHAEIRGRWTLALAEPFVITGQADRVDQRVDGTLEIIDFKTGSPPTPASMKAFEAPQLPIEALMAAAGGMEGIPAAPTTALTYVKIGLGPEAFRPSGFSLPEGMDLMQAADEVGRRAQAQIEHFLLRQTPMPARLLPLKTQRFAGTYDHLARVAEWTAVDGEDEA